MGILRWLFGVAGGDGSSASQAIVVASIGDEYAWIQRHCPGFRLEMQSLAEIDGKPYDVMSLQNAQGDKRTVYFDISRFFGKL